VKILFLFIDGVGLRPPAADNPLRPEVCPVLCRLIAEHSVPLDACLGVPGLPQSATGQTTLFTGINAARYVGRHVEGFPGPSLRHLIGDGNLLLELAHRGRRARFANGYLADSIDEIRARRFKSVTTVVALTTPAAICLRDDLLADQAVFHDLTREAMRKRGYTGPLITPAKAAEHLIQIALGYDFTLFEYFQTDIAGHARDPQSAIATLASLDAFLGPLAAMAAEQELLLVLTSDHGNIENLEGHSHTFNPVPLIAIGPGAAAMQARAVALTDVTPAVLRLLEAAPPLTSNAARGDNAPA
jgi:hypothetical protein